MSLVLAGCGGTTVKTVTEHETVAQTTAATAPRSAKSSARSTTAAAAPRAKRVTASSKSTGNWIACDSNIAALRPHTSCGFAQNAFYRYWAGEGISPIDVWSPTTKRSYSTTCTVRSARVTCRTSDGGRVRFPTTAVQAYSNAQAEAYLATHDVGPAADAASADSTSDGATPGYEQTPDYDEPGYADGDASSGDEIPNYDNGTGSRVQCADGMYSQSGGKQGACSGHGGVR